ncbi:hypothetical protein ADL08_34605 [Streptomyces sp. NRRL F-6492]|nr:hypothetical protein ADL08_34605 [Streptomyces sp. NRRL F-6492]
MPAAGRTTPTLWTRQAWVARGSQPFLRWTLTVRGAPEVTPQAWSRTTWPIRDSASARRDTAARRASWSRAVVRVRPQ